MKGPQNYEELRKWASEEMRIETGVLEDRADAMRRFASYMDACEEWSPETYASALAVADIEDYGDDEELEALHEIVENWPAKEKHGD